MPEQPDVNAGELIDAAYHNDLRDRTLQRYATASSRSALNPSPATGELSYLEDTDRVYVYTGATLGWQDLAYALNAALRGEVTIDGTRVLRVVDPDAFVYLEAGGGPVVIGDGTDECYVFGVPFQPGAFDVQCDENGAGRRLVYTGSSRRFKAGIKNAPKSLAKLAAELTPRVFYWRNDDEQTPRLGFIAEELAEVDKRLARYDGDGEPANHDLAGIVAVLTAEVQALRAEVDKLKRKPKASS